MNNDLLELIKHFIDVIYWSVSSALFRGRCWTVILVGTGLMDYGTRASLESVPADPGEGKGVGVLLLIDCGTDFIF